MPDDQEFESVTRQNQGSQSAESDRRSKLISFDWHDLPRIDWPYGQTHAKSFDGWNIPQPDGREISVQAFHQESIYAGHLLGALDLPPKYFIEGIERAKRLFPNEKSAHWLLPPTQYRGRKERVTDGKDASYDWLSLPRERCIAELFSTTSARDEHEPFSSLVVIWFQDHFGMPDAGVQKQLVELDWKTVANDWSP